MKKVTLLTLMALTSLTAAAKPQTVTLDVPTMNCVTCPFTVKKIAAKCCRRQRG